MSLKKILAYCALIVTGLFIYPYIIKLLMLFYFLLSGINYPCFKPFFLELASVFKECIHFLVLVFTSFLFFINLCFLNSFISFFVFKYFSKTVFNMKIDCLKQRINKNALVYFALFRFIPFFPSFLLGFLGGILNIKFKDYFMAFLFSFAVKVCFFAYMGTLDLFEKKYSKLSCAFSSLKIFPDLIKIQSQDYSINYENIHKR